MDIELQPIKVTPYISIVEGRRPRQKAHTHLAHAKAAFDTPKRNMKILGYRDEPGRYTHGWGAIYEYSGTEWKLLFEIPQPTPDDFIEDRLYGESFETRPWRLSN